MNKHRIVIAAGTFVLLAALATHAEAGWGRYRVSTFYGTPSVPVVQETVVVRGAYRPVVVVPAPVTAYYSAPVTTYYSGPSLYVGPRGVVRAAYYAPAPRVYYYAPAPVILP
jgi:hypothetical protein